MTGKDEMVVSELINCHGNIHILLHIYVYILLMVTLYSSVQCSALGCIVCNIYLMVKLIFEHANITNKAMIYIGCMYKLSGVGRNWVSCKQQWLCEMM